MDVVRIGVVAHRPTAGRPNLCGGGWEEWTSERRNPVKQNRRGSVIRNQEPRDLFSRKPRGPLWPNRQSCFRGGLHSRPSNPKPQLESSLPT